MTGLFGIYPALLTPFSKDGLRVQLDAIGPHIEYLRARGVHGLVPIGTNGEFPSLSLREKMLVLDEVLRCSGNLKVVCGTGACSISDAVEIAQYAQRRGVDGLLVVPPFYYKSVCDEGLAAFYGCLLERTDVPLFLYHIPQFTMVAITEGLVEKLQSKAHLAGMKDSSGDLSRIERFHKQYPRLTIFNGFDPGFAQALKAGASGAISGLANIVPQLHRAVFDAHQNGKKTGMLQKKLLQAHNILIKFPMQAAMKYFLHLAGLKETFVRPPLRNLTDKEKALLEKEVSRAGLL